MAVVAARISIAVDPSPYSLENADVIERTLEAAGFRRITVSAQDTQLCCGNAADTLSVVTRVGALGKVLRENPDLLSGVEARVCAALMVRERDEAVHLGAATWIVNAEG